MDETRKAAWALVLTVAVALLLEWALPGAPGAGVAVLDDDAAAGVAWAHDNEPRARGMPWTDGARK